LTAGQLEKALQILSENSIAYINNGEIGQSRERYDAILECAADGTWAWTESRG